MFHTHIFMLFFKVFTFILYYYSYLIGVISNSKSTLIFLQLCYVTKGSRKKRFFLVTRPSLPLPHSSNVMATFFFVLAGPLKKNLFAASLSVYL